MCSQSLTVSKWQENQSSDKSIPHNLLVTSLVLLTESGLSHRDKMGCAKGALSDTDSDIVNRTNVQNNLWTL